jgi:hypothetical protein
VAGAPLKSRVEVVRGGMDEGRAESILDFWSRNAALPEDEARRRLAEVVCVAAGAGGEIVGVNSAFPQDIPMLGGRRFMVYRSALLADASAAEPEMINAAFTALEAEYEQQPEDAIGLCVVVSDPGEMARRPEAIWPDTGLFFAGYTADDKQLRLRYFDDAICEPGLPNSQPISVTREIDYSVPERFRIEPFAESESVTAEDVVALWTREGVLPRDEAERRVSEVLLVVSERDEGLVAMTTDYLAPNRQLRMNLWYFRVFVAEAHRATHLGTQLNFRNRDLLEERFTRGEDTRAAGICFELENELMRKYYNRAVWVPADFSFIGDSAKGDPVRVHYFSGALVPEPASPS